MTSYTLFSQAAPTGNYNFGAVSGLTVGVEVDVSAACALNGIWWYSPSFATVLPGTIGLFTVSGSTLVHSETPSWSGAAGSGWVFAAFASPPALAASTAYVAAVFYSGNLAWFSPTDTYYTTGAGSGGITNGPLTAPGGSGKQGWFTNGTGSISYPSNTALDGENWWLDVQVTPASPPATHGLLMVMGM